MHYFFDEVEQKKNIVDVSIANKKVTYQLVELKPKQDLIKITGYFDEVMNYDNNHNDFIAVELLDTKIVPNAIDYLRKKYENVLQITYPNLISKQITNNTKADVGFEKLSSLELFEQFYEKIKGSKLDKEAKALVAEILKEEHNSDTK